MHQTKYVVFAGKIVDVVLPKPANSPDKLTPQVATTRTTSGFSNTGLMIMAFPAFGKN
jgi:hypothetical protein